MSVKIQDPVSALTHFIGAILSVAASVFLLVQGIRNGSMEYIVGLGVFGLSLVLLYSTSTIYHIIDTENKMSQVMKRVDHMMIFVLIAGTYTPVCLIPLAATQGGQTGLIILVIIWAVAFLGIILKLFWLHAPRWVSTAQYIFMGWIAIFAIYPIMKAMTPLGFGLLLAGGIFYTVGGVIYATKWPKFQNKWFGFHEIFHLFVMAGSLCHFFMVLTLI